MKCNFETELREGKTTVKFCEIANKKCIGEFCILQSIRLQLVEIQAWLISQGGPAPGEGPPEGEKTPPAAPPAPTPERPPDVDLRDKDRLMQKEVAELLGVPAVTICNHGRILELGSRPPRVNRRLYTWTDVNQLHAWLHRPGGYVRGSGKHRSAEIKTAGWKPRYARPTTPETVSAAHDEVTAGPTAEERKTVLDYMESWTCLPRGASLVVADTGLPAAVVKQILEEFAAGPEPIERRQRGHYIHTGVV